MGLKPPPQWLLRALAAIMITLTVRIVGCQRRRFLRMLILAHAATRSRRPAQIDDTQAALRAVRWTAQLVPARMACLEESIAAAVTVALSGRRADWRHGIASDPVRLHAWIEVAGQPIDEPASIRHYTPLICLPAIDAAGGSP